jgi:hypothetical protein
MCIQRLCNVIFKMTFQYKSGGLKLRLRALNVNSYMEYFGVPSVMTDHCCSFHPHDGVCLSFLSEGYE